MTPEESLEWAISEVLKEHTSSSKTKNIVFLKFNINKIKYV